MMNNTLHKKNILLIDDHELFRVGLRLILEPETDANIIEIEKISDLSLVSTNIDVVLLDICLPGINGLEGMSIIQKHWPKSRIMLLSASNYHDNINTALESGASCFLNKNSAPEVIIKTVQSLLKKRSLKKIFNNGNGEECSAINKPKPMLSNRLLEVLALLAQGISNKEIADQLFISEHTVRNHIATLMSHFDVHNRTQIIIEAQRAGYLSNFD
ncbi:response regulator [Psychrobacter sp. UBA3962]|uniref:response regulator transcription factor n=1 Tax=Psychrobacter sp. UBA3962 TaxID=1947352 RepID=UPI0025F80FC0|nr:response regulator transcription factor [Psychrobacter sp. UBA3962]